MIFHVPTFFRFVVILTVSFTLAFLVPSMNVVGEAENSLIHMLLLFSLLISFLINRALDRKITITSSVSTELSRLRRIHHLTEQISNIVWRRSLYVLLEAYQTSMSRQLLATDQTLKAFREMSHQVYNFFPKNARDGHFFDQLLESTRDVAIERQRRESAIFSRMASYSWIVMGTYTILIIFLLLGSREEAGFSAFSVGATITGILLVMDLLYRLNKLSQDEIERLQKSYRENTAT